MKHFARISAVDYRVGRRTFDLDDGSDIYFPFERLRQRILSNFGADILLVHHRFLPRDIHIHVVSRRARQLPRLFLDTTPALP